MTNSAHTIKQKVLAYYYCVLEECSPIKLHGSQTDFESRIIIIFYLEKECICHLAISLPHFFFLSFILFNGIQHSLSHSIMIPIYLSIPLYFPLLIFLFSVLALSETVMIFLLSIYLCKEKILQEVNALRLECAQEFLIHYNCFTTSFSLLGYCLKVLKQW